VTYASGDPLFESKSDRNPPGTWAKTYATMIFKLPNEISGWISVSKLEVYFYTNQFYAYNTEGGLRYPAAYMRYWKRSLPYVSGLYETAQQALVPQSPDTYAGFQNQGWHKVITFGRTLCDNLITGAIGGKRNVSVKLQVPHSYVYNGGEMWWRMRSQEYRKESEINPKKPHMMAAAPFSSSYAPYLVLTAVTGA
jgi:hypothetical protein